MFNHLRSALIVYETGGAENNKQAADGTLKFQASEPITTEIQGAATVAQQKCIEDEVNT